VLEDLDSLLTERTKMVAVTHQSNVLGTINPIKMIAERAHAVGALVLVDDAQGVPHMPVNVKELDIDFLALSGHKMCGPTGSGALWARHELLEQMPPFLGGGSMIKLVELEQSTYADIPVRFEAGTPAIAECIALGEAVDFLKSVGMETVHRYEHDLTAYALERLSEIEGLHIYGPHTMESRGGMVSFTMDGIHPHDIASLLDGEGIAVRAGHHCAQPLHRFLGIPATTRASFYLYNIPEEIDRLATGLEKVKKLFA
jgi:cysteine desulfurase/selenocysteine lyase